MTERDIYEVANQLFGYSDESTPDHLAEFLAREGREATALADEIVSLRTALSLEREAREKAERDLADMSAVANSHALSLNNELERRRAAESSLAEAKRLLTTCRELLADLTNPDPGYERGLLITRRRCAYSAFSTGEYQPMPKGYKGRDKTERLHVLISDEELTAIDDWRFANRISTRGDAVRRLVQIGTRAERALLGVMHATTGVSEELEEVAEVRQGATEAAEKRDADALLKSFGELFKAVDRLAARQIIAYDQIMALVAEIVPFITNPDLICGARVVDASMGALQRYRGRCSPLPRSGAEP